MDVLTIISNAAFLLPAVESARRQRWTRACIYIFIIISSSIYHTCNSFMGQCAGIPPHVARGMDFFFAQLVIPLTALYVIDFPMELYWLERVLIFTFSFVIFLLMQYFESTLLLQMILAGISFALIFIYWVWHWHTRNQTLPNYKWHYFALGIGLTSLASALFVVEMILPSFYWAVHSIWHVDAAFGQYFLILTWPYMEERSVKGRLIALDRRVMSNIRWH